MKFQILTLLLQFLLRMGGRVSFPFLNPGQTHAFISICNFGHQCWLVDCLHLLSSFAEETYSPYAIVSIDICTLIVYIGCLHLQRKDTLNMQFWALILMRWLFTFGLFICRGNIQGSACWGSEVTWVPGSRVPVGSMYNTYICSMQ